MGMKLVMTVEEMQNREAWLKLRNTGLGGSDAAVVLGVSPWKSKLELWMEKTGQKEPADLSDNERIYWGIKNEANIADWFTEVTGKKVIRRGMMRSDEYPWMLASVDREVVGERSGLEIKTAGVDQAKYWKDDEMPDGYYLQCQWYMAVTGWERWYVAVLIGGNQAIWKEIPRNEEQIAELIKASGEFWKMVETGQMPEVDALSGPALADMYPGGDRESVEMNNLATVYEQLKGLKENKKLLENGIKALENEIKMAMGNHERITIDGNKVSWLTQDGRKTIDSKRLQAEQPEVYRQYLKSGNPIRVFRA